LFFFNIPPTETVVSKVEGSLRRIFYKPNPSIEYILINFNRIDLPLEYFEKALKDYAEEFKYDINDIKLSSSDLEIPNRDSEIIEELIIKI
jgi:hypothetical protein